MVYTVNFPSALTEEEQQLKLMFETLKKLKRAVQLTKGPRLENDGSGKALQKRGLEDAEVTTEEVKRLVKAGAMTINKTEEKQTFKRSKQLDRKLKDGDVSGSTKFQPFSFSEYSDSPSSSRNKLPHLYDSFVETGDISDEQDGSNESARKGTTIYVRGYDLMEKPLKASFGEFGKIVRVHVEDRRRSAFIEFDSHAEADRAIKEMNGNMVNGITLRVTMARRQNYVPKSNNFYFEDDAAPKSRTTNSSWTAIAFGSSDKPSGVNDRDVVSYQDTDD